MKNTIWLLLIVCGFIFSTQKAKADLACSPACESPTSFCAIDPDGVGTGDVTIQSTPGVHPNWPEGGLAGKYYISGCGMPQPEIGSCNISGTSWCTGNIFDGWIIASQNSTIGVENAGYHFDWLGGVVGVYDRNNCLQPFDYVYNIDYITQCTISASVNDPDSTLPDKNFSEENHTSTSIIHHPVAYPSGGEGPYPSAFYHMEAVTTCENNIPKVTLYWNDLNFEHIIPRYFNLYSDSGNFSYNSEDPYNDNYHSISDTTVTEGGLYKYQMQTFFDQPSGFNYYVGNMLAAPEVITSISCNKNGFDLSGAKSDNDLNLSWNPVQDAVEYMVVKDGVPIFGSNRLWYYFWNQDISNSVVDSSSSSYVDYLTSTNFTDYNLQFDSPGDFHTYQIYAIIPTEFISRDMGVGDWDQSELLFNSSLYSWNSRYPWFHRYQLSEEIQVNADGSITNNSSYKACGEPCIVDADCETTGFV